MSNANTPAALETLTALVERQDWKAVIAAMSGRTSHYTCNGLWCAATTCQYGPVGIHESRCGADGRPTAETIAEFPSTVAAPMREAAERAARYAAALDRNPVARR